ncbi:dipeptidase [Candidatus Latescibacterota bacterium]
MNTRRDFLKHTTTAGITGILVSGAAPAYAKYMGRDKKTVSMEDARRLHKKCLIIDGHNDTPVERVARGKNVSTMMQRDMSFQMDVPRMQEVGFDSGAYIVGNGVRANVWVALEQTMSVIEANPSELMLVLSSGDTVRAKKKGKLGILLSIEGIAKWVLGETDILRMLYRNGVRLVGITHGEGGTDPENKQRTSQTFLQGTRSIVRLCTPAERAAEHKKAVGLTPFGREILKLNDELGIVTDLSHINDRAYFDVLEQTDKPVLMSHTAAFSRCPHFRCLTDDQIKALAQNGGAMGMIFAPQYLHPEQEKCTLDTLVEHISYVADLVGVDYIGIGTDYDGGIKAPVVPEMSQLVDLTRAMMEHGFNDKEIKQIWGGNFLRVLKQTIDT